MLLSAGQPLTTIVSLAVKVVRMKKDVTLVETLRLFQLSLAEWIRRTLIVLVVQLTSAVQVLPPTLKPVNMVAAQCLMRMMSAGTALIVVIVNALMTKLFLVVMMVNVNVILLRSVLLTLIVMMAVEMGNTDVVSIPLLLNVYVCHVRMPLIVPLILAILLKLHIVTTVTES